MTTNFYLHGIYNSIEPSTAQGLSKCFQAYADECDGAVIESIGLNERSKYVYIALENGVTICCTPEGDVQYATADYEDSEEKFFNCYSAALNYGF